MQLIELKEWYNRYKDFWTEWKTFPGNGLTEKEIVAIEVFRDNHFMIDTTELEKYHEKQVIIARLTAPAVTALKLNYEEFKEWVINKFRSYLIRHALLFGWETFLNTPIDHLHLPKAEIKYLKTFSCETVDELLNTFDVSMFHSSDLFIPFREFYLLQDVEQPGWDYFYEIPIEALPIDPVAIANVKLMECNNFQDILDKFAKPDFFKDDFFFRVIKFRQIISAERTTYQDLIKIKALKSEILC